MVAPSQTKVELPSDLRGVTRLTYIERPDGCQDDSVDGPAQRIGRIAEELGRRP
jgi:predicted nucleotide-binding protein